MRWGLLLALLGACVPARRKVPGPIVRDVAFEGNARGWFTGQSDYELRHTLETEATPFGLTVWPAIYTVTPRELDPGALVRDAYRLEVWYAHHGYLDARVDGWEVREVRPRTAHRAQVVDLVGRVTTGAPSTVRSVGFEGAPDALAGPIRAELRKSEVQVGELFDRDAVEATRQALEARLHESARPYATVDAAMAADAEAHTVDVVYTVGAGIAGRIGPVRVRGEKVVREEWITDAARLEEGAAYRLETLRQAQRRMFELGTFSIVTVEPDLSDPTRSDVPVRVKVTESKFRRLRIGVGFDYDSYLPTFRASARLRDVNVLHQLLKAEVGVKAGLAVDLTNVDLYGRLPTWAVDLVLRDPRLFHQRAAIELSGSITQDIYNGLWSFRKPEADLSMVVRATDHVQFRFGPHVERYQFLGEFGPRVQEAQQRLFGIESDEAFVYQLTAFDQIAQWDWRDDPVRTTRGSWYTLNFREAFRVAGSGYSFVRAIADARRYFGLRAGGRRSAFPVTFAGRTTGSLIVPIGSTDTIPLPERVYLGGPTSIRGFRANQVGTYSTLCTYETVTKSNGLFGLGQGTTEEERVTRYHLPDGGLAAAQVSGEVRYDWANGVILSAFADVGGLVQDPAALGPQDLRASFGIGARYDTVVGPLRLDVSLRPLYPEDAGPRRYAQCREADDTPRVVDFFDNFVDRAAGGGPPLALVFFLTFGEAL